MRRLCTLLTLVMVTATSVAFGDAADGGYAGAYLQVPIGARPTAMGGAYLAVSDDGSAPLFNPAGLARLQRPLFTSSYRAMALDRQLGYTAVAFPVRDQATIGLNWLYAGSGSVAARDNDGYLEGWEFSQKTHEIGILFAKRFEKQFSVGVDMNYVLSDMPDLSAYTLGFDFGLMVYVDEFFDRERRDSMAVHNVQIGLVARNFARKFVWNTENYDALHFAGGTASRRQEDKVPLEFGLGASARFFKYRLLLATDLLKNEKQGTELHFGGEYFVVPEFALRTGYSDGQLVAGTGYLFFFGNRQMAIDYAFSASKAGEGSDHIFSFDFMF